MKRTIIIISIVLMLKPCMAQVVRDHRKTPKPTEKPATQPGTSPVEPVIYFSPKVVLYDQPKFTGQSKELGVGTYRLTTSADFNDLASSIKVPPGFVAIIFEHANESGGYGNYVELMEDCENLSAYNFSDKISYLNIFSVDARPGYVYRRTRIINNEIVPGLWLRAGATKPDNSLPAVVSNLQPTYPEPVASLDNAPAFEDIAVYRIQLRITTGTGTDAGTDDPVYTQLNKNDKRFYLVKGYDNFKEGRAVTYDVLTDNIKRIKDIEFLRFGIKGDDGVCFKRVELIINNCGIPVFSKSWRDGKGECFDNGSSSLLPIIELSGLELRASPSWKYIVTKPSNVALCWAPTSISKEWITSIVEASFGNKLQYMEGLQWGTRGTVATLWGDAVESKVINDHTLQFDLDLQRDVVGPNPEIDVDFELDFHCINGVISADMQNFKMNTSTYGSVYNWGALLASGPVFPIVAKILNLSAIFLNPDGSVVSGACSNIFVTPQGEIKLR
jgi:hypothetical protein